MRSRQRKSLPLNAKPNRTVAAAPACSSSIREFPSETDVLFFFTMHNTSNPTQTLLLLFLVSSNPQNKVFNSATKAPLAPVIINCTFTVKDDESPMLWLNSKKIRQKPELDASLYSLTNKGMWTPPERSELLTRGEINVWHMISTQRTCWKSSCVFFNFPFRRMKWMAFVMLGSYMF